MIEAFLSKDGKEYILSNHTLQTQGEFPGRLDLECAGCHRMISVRGEFAGHTIIINDGEKITVEPSIGHFEDKSCMAHFWIRDGKVVLA